ncbi:MAG: hypothetical protein ACU84Q_12580 [Gammaproteobacteria bacterium]
MVGRTPLSAIQDSIASLYETPIGFSVEDFLITDLNVLGRRHHTSRDSAKETLYVQESEGNLDISLFINEEIIEFLNNLAGSDNWTFRDIKDYLLALEGVSHFQYLIWNAERKKSVTLFELELQAEVDKYVLASMIIAEQRAGCIPKDLHGYLFDTVSFGTDLTPPVATRYREANHYASKYCRALKSEFPWQHNQQDFLTEIRRFYRLPQNEKVRRIEKA